MTSLSSVSSSTTAVKKPPLSIKDLPAQCQKYTFTFLDIEDLSKFSRCSRNSHTMVIEYLPLRYYQKTSISPWEVYFLFTKMHWNPIASCQNVVKLRSHNLLSIRDSELIRVCPRLPLLQVFDLTEVFGQQIANVTDQGLAAIAESCPDVRSINLNNARRCTETGIRTLVGKCQKLTSLNVCNCHISESCFIDFAKLPLTALDVSGNMQEPFSHQTLQTFLSGSSQLTQLLLR